MEDSDLVTANGAATAYAADSLAIAADSSNGARANRQTAHRILIVDRDQTSANVLHRRLEQCGYAVTTVTECEHAVAAVEQTDPHLIMLDWDLPGVITMELMRHVSARLTAAQGLRTMALSSFAGEQRVVSGLEQGLDDYVVKPYSLLEVLARVRAILRTVRARTEESSSLTFERLYMDLDDNRVSVEGRRVALRTAEFRLLEFLMRHPERAFGREHLLSQVWGRDCDADVRAVDVTVQRIRKALGLHDCEGYLQTVRSVGYRLSSTAAQ